MIGVNVKFKEMLIIINILLISLFFSISHADDAIMEKTLIGIELIMHKFSDDKGATRNNAGQPLEKVTIDTTTIQWKSNDSFQIPIYIYCNPDTDKQCTDPMKTLIKRSYLAEVNIVDQVVKFTPPLATHSPEARTATSFKSITSEMPDSKSFASRSVLLVNDFDTVWAAALKYLRTQGKLTTIDREKGILIAEKNRPKFRSKTVVMVQDRKSGTNEQILLTAKAFCYKYATYQCGLGFCSAWEKSSPTLCTDVTIKGITNGIEKMHQ